MLSISLCRAQEPSIIPKPQFVETNVGYFPISSSTKLLVKDKKLKKSAGYFNAYLQKYYGIKLTTGESAPAQNAIVLRLSKQDSDNTGAYKLEVNNTGVNISGNTDTAVFYGLQTLIQLLPVYETTDKKALNIPQITIKDEPRFSYRGAMLDVSRFFQSAEFIKKFIDLLALHKLNTFHWHLTDDQGWRIEIKKYPLLTEVGSIRNGTLIGHYRQGKSNDHLQRSGYYTQAEIRDIVQYAADRYINVIPEIELPGHSSAAIAAYPQLSCFPDEPSPVPEGFEWSGSKEGKQVQQTWGIFADVYAPTEYTFHFLQNVLDEVTALFPAKYIHIGGDECPKEYWKRSAFCQNLIKEKNLKDEHGLQSYFVGKIEKYLNSKGRNIIGWDEILEGGLAPNATVMSWRGENGGIEAARQKHKVIMTPNTHTYFANSQLAIEDSATNGSFTPVQKVYNYDPVPQELSAGEQKYVQGVQATTFAEYITNPAKVEYAVFPRLAALSEVAWTKKENKDYPDFRIRMENQLHRYKMWKVNYCEKWDNQPDKR
ncbi:MAG: beta-N-acetylhexosaminidase [Chitinophagaceae bacterium]|nr:beta-N-acetylhexosaminidase [Chitinophagaceae bacterium]